MRFSAVYVGCLRAQRRGRHTSSVLSRTAKEDAREKGSGLGGGADDRRVSSFGCQGEGAQEKRTSDSSEVTIQVGNGVVDAAPSKSTAPGEPTTLTANERFSEANLHKVDEFV